MYIIYNSFEWCICNIVIQDSEFASPKNCYCANTRKFMEYFKKHFWFILQYLYENQKNFNI